MSEELRPLPAFDYVAPRTLAQAVELLGQHGEAAKLLAGGTDLLPRMKKRKHAPRLLIDVSRLSELSFIEARDGVLRMGAGTTLSALRASSVVREQAEALADAVAIMASPGIRNRATLGGNLCNASRCADTPPPLLALDASVRLRSRAGERVVPLSEFFTIRGAACGKTVLRADEIMTEVLVPWAAGRSTFSKLGRRKGSSVAIASAAVFARIAAGSFEEVRVAVGAIGSTPVRGLSIERLLKGARASEESIAGACAAIRDEINPLSDVRASSAYRREMVPLLIRRALTTITQGGDKRCA